MRRSLRPSRASFVLAASLLAVVRPPAQGTPGFKLVGWNNLGMHCMDADYSVFSILPPYNVVDAQLIGANGRLLRSDTGLRLTFEAVADPSGSINTTGIGKTNYWRHAPALYGGSSTPDTGLAGCNMPGPGNVPQAMAFSPATAVFEADGVPITPYDDRGHKRPYPLMRLRARDGTGRLLAQSDVVLPVSDEMDCRACHGSGAPTPAQPTGGWVWAPDAERDYRLNILRLHDELHGTDPVFVAALGTAGYRAAGLEATVMAGTPILCARCHASNALPGTGIPGIAPLTEAVHSWHAHVRDPLTNERLDASTNRTACYRCHPGSDTRCLRGAMGSAVAADGSRAMQCQGCHGNMSSVGRHGRVGWLEQPACQNCHTGTAVSNNGQIRYTSAFDATGQLRTPVDATFATNADTPAPGFSLYRFSSGHGGLRCEACHGSTHAEYPAAHGNDNLQSQALQGHAGTLVECGACHTGAAFFTLNRGPHGMHTLGADWIEHHPDQVENNGGPGQCRACHGADYRGTVLSLAQADRDYSTHFGQKTFPKGTRISCYACHNGPNTSNANPNRPPVAAPASITCVDAPVSVDLSASDPDSNPLTLRIVTQPAHGTVALSGNRATYVPEAGFAGTDQFQFAAWDGAVEAVGNVVVTRGATWASYGAGYPGTGGQVPAFVADAHPVLGSTIHIALANTPGVETGAVWVLATESASIPTPFGGVLLAEPQMLLPLTVPAAGLTVALAVPNDPALLGAPVCSQALQLDLGARFLLAFSRGLRLIPGR